MRYKKNLPLIFLLLAMVLLAAGCVRNVAPAPTATIESISDFEGVLSSTPIPDDTEVPEPTATPTETPEPPAPTETPAPTNTLQIVTPTNAPETVEETEEPAGDEETTPSPTETAGPQPTSNVPQINPDEEFTGAHYVDSMDEIEMWTDKSGVLPDTQYIKLQIEDGVMTVTGKRSLWDTWWISGFTLNDFYIEMDVNTGDCNSDDAYGMILRANQSGEPTRGYLIGFTCDGKVFARRLESVSPYVAISILNPTETDLIFAGKNQENTIGVLFDGNTITIYPNRRFFTTIADDGFAWGRYGIFVSAGEEGNFTFTVDEIRSWGVVK